MASIIPGYFGAGIGDDVGVALGTTDEEVDQIFSNFDRTLASIANGGNDFSEIPCNLLDSSAE